MVKDLENNTKLVKGQLDIVSDRIIQLKRISERFKFAKRRAAVRESVRMLHGCSPVPRPSSYTYIALFSRYQSPILVWLVGNFRLSPYGINDRSISLPSEFPFWCHERGALTGATTTSGLKKAVGVAIKQLLCISGTS